MSNINNLNLDELSKIDDLFQAELLEIEKDRIARLEDEALRLAEIHTPYKVGSIVEYDIGGKLQACYISSIKAFTEISDHLGSGFYVQGEVVARYGRRFNFWAFTGDHSEMNDLVWNVRREKI